MTVKSVHTVKPSDGLNIKVETLKNFVVFEIQGTIDMVSSPGLRNRLLDYYTKGRGIIVDLSDVTVMDSSGVATLVEGLAWSKKENKEFILIGLGVNVYNLLSLSKLETIFNIRTGLSTIKHLSRNRAF